MCALAVASKTTSWRERTHGSQRLRTRRFHAHSFVVARLGSQLAGRGERPSLLRPSRACLRYRPLLPGSSNLGGGRGPRDSLLPGRIGGDVSRRLPEPIVSVCPTPPQARRSIPSACGLSVLRPRWNGGFGGPALAWASLSHHTC